jgi:hypothetical protein
MFSIIPAAMSSASLRNNYEENLLKCTNITCILKVSKRFVSHQKLEEMVEVRPTVDNVKIRIRISLIAKDVASLMTKFELSPIK